MKVKCKNCGKIFDPEKTSSMCPKCGMWNTGANHYDIGSSGQNTIYDCENCQDSNEGREGKVRRSDSRITVIVTVVGVVCIILLRLVTGIYLKHSDTGDSNVDYYDEFDDEENDAAYDESDYGDENFYVDSIPVIGYAYGDKMLNNNDSKRSEWLTINSVKPVELEDAAVPDGYIIYDMDYDLESQGDSFANLNTGDSCYDVYLRSNSWRMLRPLSQQDIDDLMIEDGYAVQHGAVGDIPRHLKNVSASKEDNRRSLLC